VSSLSCALPIFLAAIGVVVGQTLNSDSFLEILIGSLAYALGMGIVLITLTLITVSFKKLTFAQKSARTLTPYVNISGKLMMVFGGGYIIYYWTFGIGGALLSYRLEQLIN
jgi:cytochrome c biogenesis protein CcdA